MWKGEDCGECFCEPNLVSQRENLDGENGWWHYTEAYCPNCGSESIFETEEDDDDTL